MESTVHFENDHIKPVFREQAESILNNKIYFSLNDAVHVKPLVSYILYGFTRISHQVIIQEIAETTDQSNGNAKKDWAMDVKNPGGETGHNRQAINSIEFCIEICSNKSYTYAGMQVRLWSQRYSSRTII